LKRWLVILSMLVPSLAQAYSPLDTLTAGCWLAVKNNAIRDVLPSPLALGDPEGITKAWGAGAVDTQGTDTSSGAGVTETTAGTKSMR